MERKRESFFSRLFSRKQAEELVTEPIIDEANAETVARTLPHTIITFTEEQEKQFSEAEKEKFQQELLKLPPLVVGQVNFVPFEIGELYGGYYVKVFIRNGRELLEDLTLEELTLYLVDATGDKVAGGHFRLQNFGSLKFGETRMWTFAWREEEVLKRNPDFSGFTVAFR